MAHWGDVFPGGVHEVRYEELVAEPDRVSRRLIDYLDLEWDDGCLAFHENERSVMSPSNLQVRRPIYNTSIGRWHRYERHLGPLIEVLEGTGDGDARAPARTDGRVGGAPTDRPGGRAECSRR